MPRYRALQMELREGPLRVREIARPYGFRECGRGTATAGDG
jgi:hypothetical protein